VCLGVAHVVLDYSFAVAILETESFGALLRRPSGCAPPLVYNRFMQGSQSGAKRAFPEATGRVRASDRYPRPPCNRLTFLLSPIKWPLRCTPPLTVLNDNLFANASPSCGQTKKKNEGPLRSVLLKTQSMFSSFLILLF
jgi:hypothetical protein